MGQRYPPTKPGKPIFDGASSPSIQTEIGQLTALEMNTLQLVGEFETAAATATVVPWVLIKGQDGTGADVELWTPLAQVTLVAGAGPPAIPPITPNWFKAPMNQSEIPNCHAVRLELAAVSVDSVTIWAGLTNRSPR